RKTFPLLPKETRDENISQQISASGDRDHADFHHRHRIHLSWHRDGSGAIDLSQPGQWQPGDSQWQDHWLRTDRTLLDLAPVLPWAAARAPRPEYGQARAVRRR